MSGVFLTVINMSISASWILLAVVLLRLFLKKAPKWPMLLLWGMVAVRLIVPIALESPLSLMPNMESLDPGFLNEAQVDANLPANDAAGENVTDDGRSPVAGGAVTEGIQPPITGDSAQTTPPTVEGTQSSDMSGTQPDSTQRPIIDGIESSDGSGSLAPTPENSADPLQIWIPMLSVVWLSGMTVLLIYTAVSYLRVRRNVRTAVHLKNNIYQCETVVSPFVLGLIKPRIYLPFRMSETDIAYVIAHEEAHIRRRDHWWKPLGFLILTMHWFNPLMWLGYVLLCRDIELACDEKVVKQLKPLQRADYSQALLNCSVNRRMIAACPLAFGEVSVKERVKTVLNYKKPAFWVVIVAVLALVVTAVCFLTNPTTINKQSFEELDPKLQEFLQETIQERYRVDDSDTHFVAASCELLGTEEGIGETKLYAWVMYERYTLDETIAGVIREGAAHIPTVISVKKNGEDYELVKYWVPRDGSYYTDDIKGAFPRELWDQALDSQITAEKQRESCEEQAMQYFFTERKMTVTRGKNGNWWVDGFDSGIKIGASDCTEAAMNENGHLILTMSDGSTVNAGTWCRHYVEIIAGKEATCKESGLTEGKRCKICGEVFVKQEVILAKHQYENWICKFCGESDGLPGKMDLNRYVYNAYIHSNATGSSAFMYTEDFWIDPDLGASDVLSLAVMERNSQIERDFNCSIRATESTRRSQYDEMKFFYDSDRTFDLAIINATDAALCAADGMLSDLNAIKNQKYLNFEHKAYDQNSIEQLAIGNSLYYLSGDMNISTVNSTLCTIFNTDLFAKNKDKIVDALGSTVYGDLYQMRDTGKWTTENMMKIASVVTYDKDPEDGTLRYDKGDIIGHYDYTAGTLYYYYGTGMRISENVNGYPTLSITTDAGRDAYNYVFDTFNVNLNADVPRGASGDRARNFQAGSVLFADYILWDVRRVLYAAESEIAYGILPLSTKEENATPYSVVSYYYATTHLWSIPTKTKSAENAPLMMQIMAAYSALPDSTFDAYCKKSVYQAQDAEGIASLDMIRENLVYDTAMMYNWGGFYDLLVNAGTADEREYDTYTSEEAIKAAEDALQESMKQFRENSK